MISLKKTALSIGLAAALAVTASPVLAGWKLVQDGQPTAVAKSTLTVTAGEDWNRSSYRPIKKSEVWTLDGPVVNELYFVAGLVPGETLYANLDRKNNPLPLMGSNLQLAEIPEFVEGSMRMSLKTSVFEMGTIEPVQFAGRQGVKFRYEYAVQGSSIRRKGIASAALVDGKLYMINFTAPALNFFDRDAPKVEAIMASARL